MERWAPIEGHANYYVSNIGRVKSLKRGEPLLRSIGVDKDGYSILWMSTQDKVDTSARVHRLVAQAFIPNPDNKPVVHHKNNIKNDNRVENLEWATISENTRYAHADGVLTSPTRKYLAVKLDGNVISIFTALYKLADHIGINRNSIARYLKEGELFLGALTLEEIDESYVHTYDDSILNKSIVSRKWRGNFSKTIVFDGIYYKSLQELAKDIDVSWQIVNRRISSGIINVDGTDKKIRECTVYEYLKQP